MRTSFIVLCSLALLLNVPARGSQHQLSNPRLQKIEQLLESQKKAVGEIDGLIFHYVLILPMIASNASAHNSPLKAFQSAESQARCGIDLLYYNDLKKLAMDRHSQEILCEMKSLDRVLE